MEAAGTGEERRGKGSESMLDRPAVVVGTGETRRADTRKGDGVRLIGHTFRWHMKGGEARRASRW